MSRDEYLKTIKRAQTDLDATKRELQDVEERRLEISKRMQHLQQTIDALSALVDPHHDTDIKLLGLTDACREIVKTSARPLTPPQVRDALSALAYDMSSYADPLKAVRTVMGRLYNAKEINATSVDPKSDEAGAVWLGGESRKRKKK